MKHRLLQLAALAAALCALDAQAAFHRFMIDQVFSNADGTVQYVVLRETNNSNSQNAWSGRSFSTTDAAGTMKQITFGANLPSTNTAGQSVLIATPGFAGLGLVTPDFMIPARFIPTEGGSVNYAGSDTIMLPPLPRDGVTAIDRNGMLVPAMPRNFSNATAAMTATPVGNVEFYHAGLDHYFISALAADIDALDSGRLMGWARTGGGFQVHPSQAAGGPTVNPVCRIRIPPEKGDSHFYSASPQECDDSLAKNPGLTLESLNVYYVALPTMSGPNAGACMAGTIPVYRVWNNRVDSNHRYTPDRAVRDQMVARGGIAEGYGDDAVIMCALAGVVGVNSASP